MPSSTGVGDALVAISGISVVLQNVRGVVRLRTIKTVIDQPIAHALRIRVADERNVVVRNVFAFGAL
jgi:hypothetical protein